MPCDGPKRDRRNRREWSQSGHQSATDGTHSVNDDWQGEEISSAVRDVENAEFVALDFEFSGLFSNFGRRDSQLEIYFNTCAENSRKFSILQLGICAVSRSPDKPNLWKFAPYNFYCLPHKRTVFASDTKTLQWLLENGFDFHEWLRRGYDYTQLAIIQAAEQQTSGTGTSRPIPEKVKTLGLQRLIEAIVECEVPLVLHNGLFDLLHLCDKFIGDIPRPLARFCGEILRLFSGGIYDTKHVAMMGLTQIFHLIDSRTTSLQDLRSHLMRMGVVNQYDIADHRRQFIADRNYSFDPADSNGIHANAHEAGWDAMATAQVFLMELELIFDFQREQKNDSFQEGVGHAIIPDKNSVLSERAPLSSQLASHEVSTLTPVHHNARGKQSQSHSSADGRPLNGDRQIESNCYANDDVLILHDDGGHEVFGSQWSFSRNDSMACSNTTSPSSDEMGHERTPDSCKRRRVNAELKASSHGTSVIVKDKSSAKDKVNGGFSGAGPDETTKPYKKGGFGYDRMRRVESADIISKSKPLVPLDWSKMDSEWWNGYKNSLEVPVYPGYLNFSRSATQKQ